MATCSPPYLQDTPEASLTERNPQNLSGEDLVEYAEHARDQYIQLWHLNRAHEKSIIDLQKENKRVLSFSSFSGFPSTWIRAHIDSPDETSASCFGEKIKHPVIVAYYPGRSSLKMSTKDQLAKDNARGIYTRLPSHRARTLYVSHTASARESGREYWVSTKKYAQPDFVLHWTIHLNRLGLLSRARIWMGRTRWLFIAFEEEKSEVVSASPVVPQKMGEKFSDDRR